MRKLRQLCAVTVLTLVLAASAFAGIIDCPGAPAPATSEPDIVTSIVLAIVSLVS